MLKPQFSFKAFLTTLACFLVLLPSATTASLPFALAAENYDIKEMTPAIQEALQNRSTRYQEIQGFKAEGSIGENNQGLLEALKPSPQVNSLIEAENADRETIYQAIVDQNQLGPRGMAQVKMVFADVQREKARPGDAVQLSSGEWTQK